MTEEAGVLRLAWDNRAIQKEWFAFWFLLGFWVIWAPLTLLATATVFRGGGEACFFACWSVFGWLGTLLIPYTLLGRWWSEWVEVSTEGDTIGAAGLLAPGPRTFSLEAIYEVALSWYRYGSDHESMVTLRVVSGTASGFRGGVLFGYWLAPELKREVFEAIRAFVEARAIPLKVTTYGEFPSPPRKAGEGST